MLPPLLLLLLLLLVEESLLLIVPLLLMKSPGPRTRSGLLIRRWNNVIVASLEIIPHQII
jgi:hypothetical protein